jgi:hypothetical protein
MAQSPAYDRGRTAESLEERVGWMADELLMLKEQVSDLNTRLLRMSTDTKTSELPEQKLEDVFESEDSSSKPVGKSWSRVGQEVLLPRLAAVSFMLVAALLLRTVTDNGMLPSHLGTFIGLIYAAGLIFAGIWLYSRQSCLASVFPVCGILLFCAVLLEGHTKFAALGSVSTNIILLLSMLVTGGIALRYRANILLFIVVWVSSISAFAIDFPNPQFLLFGLLVLANAVFGHLAKKLEMSTALRWNTLILSALFWMTLSFKLNFALVKRPADLPPVSLNFFPVLLFLFWAFYNYTTLWTIRVKRMAHDIFHRVVPVIIAGGTFFAAYAVIVPWLGGERILGLVGVVASALYMGLVAWLAKKHGDSTSGKEFVLAAILLLVQGLLFSAPGFLAMPIMLLAATVLLVRSKQWQSPGTRVIAYLFNLGIVLWGIAVKTFMVASTPWMYGILLSGFWALCALWAYRWCRANPPEINNGFFNFIDGDDNSAVILLLIGLYQIYAVLRFVVFGIISNTMTDYTAAFYCARSIILNLGVIVLMLVGLKLRNKEMLVTAALLVVIAAAKVFLFDLFRTSGLPLVLSVLTFGIVAVVSSVVMKKWGQARPQMVRTAHPTPNKS